jgi:hypothetical protein
VELSAQQPELLEHRATRRRRSNLLLRHELTSDRPTIVAADPQVP